MMRRMCFVLMLGIALIGMGCGRSKTRTVTGSNGEKYTVSEIGDKVDVTYTGKSGEKVQVTTSEKGGSLPDGFPKDVPVYPGAAINISSKTRDGIMVMLKCNESPEKIKKYYEKENKEQGWEENQNTVVMDKITLLGYKKDGRTLTVTINADKETMIQLMIAEDKAN
jgi:hypothetical protein